MIQKYRDLKLEKRTTNSLFWTREEELLVLSRALAGHQLSIPFLHLKLKYEKANKSEN